MYDNIAMYSRLSSKSFSIQKRANICLQTTMYEHTHVHMHISAWISICVCVGAYVHMNRATNICVHWGCMCVYASILHIVSA